MVTGGVKSGKSDYALERGARVDGEKIFLATAQARDEEMKARIENHRKERPAEWRTLEEPFKVADALNRRKTGVFIIDCLTIWTSNHLEVSDDDVFQSQSLLLAEAVGNFGGTAILVTNEVGLGIIPADAASRKYGRWLGSLNRQIAAVCDEVVLMVAGQPVFIKRGI